MRPLVKGDHIASKAGFIEGFFFDFRNDSSACRERILCFGACLGRGINPGCNIFNAHEDIKFHRFAFGFFSISLGMKTITVIIAILGAHFLKGISGNMVIGHYQAVCRNKRTRTTTVESHRGFLQMIEPGICGFEIVLGFEVCLGRIVEQPHAFIAQKRRNVCH